jgi:hypothetical protein
VAPWLDRAAIVVHASLTADLPECLHRALASKRALVTNTLAGTSEILENGRDAMVVRRRCRGALRRDPRSARQRARREQMAEAATGRICVLRRSTWWTPSSRA